VGYPPLIFLVVALHYLFIAAAIFGGIAVLRWPRLAAVHLAIVIWAVLVVAVPFTCPLTSLENSLRRRAGWHTYSAGFLQRYVDPGLADIGLGRVVPYLGYVVLGLNLALYALLIVRYLTRRARTSGAID
jgi:hypothetical protein